MKAAKKTPATDLWSGKHPPAKDVEAFIRASPKGTQAKLKQLRDIIKEAAPGAVGTISYRMPVYKLNGKPLAGFAGFKNHIGFYPMSGSFLDKYKDDLKEYVTTKGGIQLPLADPLPVPLIKRLLKDRVRSVA